MDSPNSRFTERDLTPTANVPTGGISAVMLRTLGGPLGDVSTIVTGWEQFRRIYGGFAGNVSNARTLQVKRALEGGSALRISRLAHYADIDNATSHTMEFAVQAASQTFTLSGTLSSTHTLTLTDGTKTISQPFTGDTLSTLQALVRKINAVKNAEITDVRQAYVQSSLAISVIPYSNTPALTLAVTGAPAVTVTKTSPLAIANSAGETLFSLPAKYPGAYYNNLVRIISPGSNGRPGYFDLTLDLVGSGFEPEVYKNITIPNKGAANLYSYLQEVEKSKWVKPVYLDLSAIVGNTTPVPVIIGSASGSEGDALVAADYIGSSVSKTGFNAFDGYDDFMQLAILEDNAIPNGVHQAGANYADNRKDFQYFIYIPGDTEASVITAKDALGIDSSYVMFFAGPIRIIDPTTSNELLIPPLGDILGLAATSETNYGGWYSFSGPNRGVIPNILGAGNQWGAKGNTKNLDALANHQINVVINRNKKVVLWGSFTGKIGNSKLSFANVRRFNIILKKMLGPIIDSFLEEPLDIVLFRQIYLAVKDPIDGFISKRALWEYRWEGDQFANTLEDLVVNDPNDVGMGKYKAQLFTKNIVTLQEFRMDVVLVPNGVSFEDMVLSNNP